MFFFLISCIRHEFSLMSFGVRHAQPRMLGASAARTPQVLPHVKPERSRCFAAARGAGASSAWGCASGIGLYIFLVGLSKSAASSSRVCSYVSGSSRSRSRRAAHARASGSAPSGAQGPGRRSAPARSQFLAPGSRSGAPHLASESGRPHTALHQCERNSGRYKCGTQRE